MSGAKEFLHFNKIEETILICVHFLKDLVNPLLNYLYENRGETMEIKDSPGIEERTFLSRLGLNFPSWNE